MIKSNDFKNSTLDADSLLDNRICLIVVPALKNVSFVDFTCSFKFIQTFHVIAVVSVYAISDLFSVKIKQSIVLIRNTNRQVRNAPCDDWKINDLCQHFRYFISWYE